MKKFRNIWKIDLGGQLKASFVHKKTLLSNN